MYFAILLTTNKFFKIYFLTLNIHVYTITYWLLVLKKLTLQLTVCFTDVKSCMIKKNLI